MPALIEHRVENGTEVKRCPDCNTWKPLDEYTKERRRADGLFYICRNCLKDMRHNRLQKDKDYRKANREKVNTWNRTMYNRSKENQTVVYKQRRVRENIARRLRLLMKGQKSQATIDLIGCSFDDLKIHLESTWTEGMSWENYGSSGWHIDHVIPCSAFVQDDEIERRACWNYRNLRALWGDENISKSDAYNQDDKDAYLRLNIFATVL